MKVLLLPPSRSLIDEIVSNLQGSGKDYSDYLIVFPGKRPSHFIRKALAQREKTSLIPPLIFSMDEFVDYIFEKKSEILRRKIEAIDSVAILYELHKKAKKPVGGESFMSPDSFFPLGLKIYEAIEELYIEEVEPRKVREIEHVSNEVIPEQTASRLQSLFHFYEEFYRTIERENYSTRSFRYRAVSEGINNNIDLSRFRRIIIAGFFALTNSERILFKKISKWDHSLFIFQEGAGIKDKLQQLDINVDDIKQADANKKEGGREPDFFFYQSPDAHGQVFGLSEIIKNNIKNSLVPDENSVIVLPSSETLFPLLHNTLALVDKDNYNISMGYPLHRTPLFGFFNSLMSLIISMEGDRFYIPDYLKFILHPYTKNIYFKGRSDITRIMFHFLENKLAEKKTKSFISLAEIEGNEIFFKELAKELHKSIATEILEKDHQTIPPTPPLQEGKDLLSPLYKGGKGDLEKVLKEHLKTIHENIIHRFESFKNVKDFALKSIEILTYIHNNSTARLHPFFYPFSEEFIRSLDIISGSLFKDISFNETAGYFNFFKKYIMTCRTPFEGTPVKGLQVLGFLETRNLKFNNVFILDANEGILPDVRKEDSFLPYKVRKILGVSTYTDREQLAAYYFDTLTKGARCVYIFFVEQNKKEKSRFVEKIIWEKQKKDKKANSRDYIKSIQYEVKLNKQGPTPKRKSDDMVKFLRTYTYSATSVDIYLRCPLMFYFRYVLSLEEKKLVSGDIEKVEIGNFVHKLLSLYFQNRRGSRLEKKSIDFDEMDELVDKIFAEYFGEEQTGTAYLLKIQIKKRMKEFLEKYQIPLIEKNDIQIFDLEYKLKVSVNSFNLRGKIDRIEKRNGKTYIIDYKTSKNDQYLKINFGKLDPEDRNNWNETIGSLQLPFYLILYTLKTGENVENVNGLFLPLSKLTIDENIELPLFQSTEEAINYFPLLQDIIFKLLDEIINPDIPFKPASNRKKSCLICEFQSICGV